MRLFRQRFVLLLCLLAPFSGLAAYDSKVEKRWQALLGKRVEQGQLVRLKTGTQPFVAIFRANTGHTTYGGAILVHDIGRHPDWNYVTRPLRIGLSNHGWNTLSIQVPVLGTDKRLADYQSLFADASARINAAIAYLKKLGIKKVVLIGHGLGAWMSLYAVSTTPKMSIEGLVMIGIDARTKDPKLRPVTLIKRLVLPVLDLYGENDLESTIRQALSRKQAARSAGLVIPVPYSPSTGDASTYRQFAVDGANHDFEGQDDVLLGRVRGWLKQLPTWRRK
jgi:pimeloyl-ACP methyl ester carboxylesterase